MVSLCRARFKKWPQLQVNPVGSEDNGVADMVAMSSGCFVVTEGIDMMMAVCWGEDRVRGD